MAHTADHISIALVHALTASYPASPPEVPLRALKYSPNVTLSFVLLNEDAAAGDYVQSWDIEESLRSEFAFCCLMSPVHWIRSCRTMSAASSLSLSYLSRVALMHRTLPAPSRRPIARVQL